MQPCIVGNYMVFTCQLWENVSLNRTHSGSCFKV